MTRFLNFLRNIFDDLLLVAGCLCILRGLSLVSVVVTWIAAGVMLVAFGVLVGKVRSAHVAQ